MQKSFLVAFSLLISALAFSQSKDEEAIRKVLNDQTAAWNQGNLESFMHGYWESDSLSFIGKAGVKQGWKITLDNYKKGYPDTTSMGKLSFDIIDVKNLSPQYFYVIGKWYLKRTIGDLSGHFTLLFKKISGRWVIISDHSS